MVSLFWLRAAKRCKIRRGALLRGHATHSSAKGNAYDTIAPRNPRGKRGKTSTFSDLAASDSVFRREIQEFAARREIPFDKVENSVTHIENFHHSASRPQAIVRARIQYQASNGEGLALVPKLVYTADSEASTSFTVLQVPKTVVGDEVELRIKRHFRYHAEAELLSVVSPGPTRNDRMIICSHFDSCSGCQFQMVSYDEQMQLKQDTIRKAYRFLCPELNQDDSFGAVVPSPLQYAYRSKLTPHFKFRRENFVRGSVPNIGFQHAIKEKGIVDITECPIATPVVRKALETVRETAKSRILQNLESNINQRGATLFLRESMRLDSQTGKTTQVCLTDPKKICTEKIGDQMFQFPAGEFFQINRSILSYVLEFVRYSMDSCNIANIVDAYCGLGFFGVSLAKTVKEGKVVGIEISNQAIKYASHNAKLNGLAVPDNVRFVEGTSSAIFSHSSFVAAGLDPEKTLVIIDPSRKGSDESFLLQLNAFGPKLIVYVSCNVFTQARDIQYFMSLLQGRYAVKDVVGFDFFPQTKHVEAVAVLEKK